MIRVMVPAYSVPDSPEGAEYKRLSDEILHCLDNYRAREISRRLEELRTSSPSVEVEVDPAPPPPMKTVGEMKVGDVGYAAPWALRVHEDGHTIDADSPVEPQPLGTMSMRVVRLENGFAVDVRNSNPVNLLLRVAVGRAQSSLPVVSVAGRVTVLSEEEMAVCAALLAKHRAKSPHDASPRGRRWRR